MLFFNDTATTEIYTLSLHDALPIWLHSHGAQPVSTEARSRRCVSHFSSAYPGAGVLMGGRSEAGVRELFDPRSAEHTSELPSRQYLVCRLLLETKTHQRPAQLNPAL